MRLLTDEVAFRSSFANFDDGLNGLTDEKLQRIGQAAKIVEIFDDKTITCQFHNRVQLDFPWESVEMLVSCDLLMQQGSTFSNSHADRAQVVVPPLFSSSLDHTTQTTPVPNDLSALRAKLRLLRDLLPFVPRFVPDTLNRKMVPKYCPKTCGKCESAEPSAVPKKATSCADDNAGLASWSQRSDVDCTTNARFCSEEPSGIYFWKQGGGMDYVQSIPLAVHHIACMMVSK